MEVNFIWIEDNTFVLENYKTLNLPKEWVLSPYPNAFFTTLGCDYLFQPTLKQPENPYITRAFTTDLNPSCTFNNVLEKITFPGYTFELKDNVLRVKYDEPDIFTGVNETQYGRPWLVEAKDEMQFIQTCFKALLTSLEHRARESFKYDGLPLMFPHRTLKEAVQQAKREKSDVAMPEINFK